ncbi:MAG TPA: aminoglycoside phosphotransferase family protein [Mucilaginibacter sp.]
MKVISVHGVAGKKWLDDLDGLIGYCKTKWQFEIIEVEKLSFNFVVRVQLKDNSKAILKLGLPGKELQSELEALTAYNGQGYCKMLDAEAEKGIMLLEYIEPGTYLNTIQDDIAKTTTIVNLIKSMAGLNPLSLYPFQTAGDFYHDLLRLYVRFGNTDIPEYLFKEAISAYNLIESDPHPQRLLHGDLHQENIILGQDGEWKAIDPKGVISETGYELFPFLVNDVEGKDIATTINKRIETFSDQLKIKRERIVQWGIFRSVLSAYWQIEDNLPISDQDLLMCEVFYGFNNSRN